jgi:hypothetical protein
MIIRVLADGQYRLDGSELQGGEEISRLDDDLVRELEADDEAGFNKTLAQLIEHIHAAGRTVPVAELLPSDMIVPAKDMTLAETRHLLSAPG